MIKKNVRALHAFVASGVHMREEKGESNYKRLFVTVIRKQEARSLEKRENSLSAVSLSAKTNAHNACQKFHSSTRIAFITLTHTSPENTLRI